MHDICLRWFAVRNTGLFRINPDIRATALIRFCAITVKLKSNLHLQLTYHGAQKVPLMLQNAVH